MFHYNTATIDTWQCKISKKQLGSTKYNKDIEKCEIMWRKTFITINMKDSFFFSMLVSPQIFRLWFCMHVSPKLFCCLVLYACISVWFFLVLVCVYISVIFSRFSMCVSPKMFCCLVLYACISVWFFLVLVCVYLPKCFSSRYMHVHVSPKMKCPLKNAWPVASIQSWHVLWTFSLTMYVTMYIAM